jgi:hypothetical protein
MRAFSKHLSNPLHLDPTSDAEIPDDRTLFNQSRALVRRDIGDAHGSVNQKSAVRDQKSDISRKKGQMTDDGVDIYETIRRE